MTISPDSLTCCKVRLMLTSAECYEGRSEVLQLDHEEVWKCYKLHCIFQYSHH